MHDVLVTDDEEHRVDAFLLTQILTRCTITDVPKLYSNHKLGTVNTMRLKVRKVIKSSKTQQLNVIATSVGIQL